MVRKSRGAMSSDETPATPDLSTVTLDEIVAELERRYDGLLILAETDRTGRQTAYATRYDGGASRAMGMSLRFLLRMCWREFAVPDESEGG